VVKFYFVTVDILIFIIERRDDMKKCPYCGKQVENIMEHVLEECKSRVKIVKGK
jgi:hypothetical protein